MDFEESSLDEPRDSNKSGLSSQLDAEKKRVEVSPQEAAATAVSRIVLGLILLVSFSAGCWVAATALHHPDACWFLALGRWIYEHGAVPDLDPFSWTMTVDAVKGHPFVVDQWLSALISYLSTLSGGLLTLLMLNAVIIVTAFLSLPLGFVVRRGAPFVPGLLLVLLSMLTAVLCPTSCTQIFSYLFIAIFLQVIHHARSAMLWQDDKVFRIAYVLVPLMVLWVNLHAGFVFGLLILACCLLGTQLSKFFVRNAGRSAAKALTLELLIALVGSLLATFATPYGWNIWATFYPLGEHFALTSYSYWAFCLLCLAFVIFAVREISACLSKRNSAAAEGQLISKDQITSNALVVAELVTALLVGCVAIVPSLIAPKLIVFTTLIVLGEILALLGLRRLAAHTDAALVAAQPAAVPAKRRTFWQDLNFHSLDVWLAGGAFELAIVSFCSIAGVCLVANKVHKPELPASEKFEEVSLTRLFANPAPGVNYKSAPNLPTYSPSPSTYSPNLSTVAPALAASTPSKALQFIEQNKSILGEKLFNDAAFGSLLDWQLRASPKVFIDTRYGSFERRIVEDYQAIIDCSPRCHQLLDGYAIDSVFVPANSKLAQMLTKDSGWQTVYGDMAAVIFVRKKPGTL